MAHSISAVSQAGTAVLAFFFFVRDEETILAAIAGLMPLSRAETGRLLARVAEAVRTAIYGRVLVGLAQGFLGGVIFAVVGLPAPVFWGAVMSFLSMLPMLGAFIVWVPAAVYLAAMGDWVRALIVTGWGVAVIHPADNLLYPMIAGQRMGMHTLVLFVAFVGGLIAFGPAGLILGPCIVAFAAALADVWRERAAGEGRAE
jgi:predicted PurR-regulated permease PerM